MICIYISNISDIVVLYLTAINLYCNSPYFPNLYIFYVVELEVRNCANNTKDI